MELTNNFVHCKTKGGPCYNPSCAINSKCIDFVIKESYLEWKKSVELTDKDKQELKDEFMRKFSYEAGDGSNSHVNLDKCELLVFDAPWDAIPKNTHPAFRKSLFYKRNQPNWYAVVVCQVISGSRDESVVGSTGYTVTDCSVDVPDVVRLGVFHNKDNAILFAKAYINNKLIP